MYCVDDDLFDVLYNLHSICAKVVKDTYEKYKLDICFPIDICKVAEFLNVQISRSDLNRLWPDEFLQYITYIQPYENKKEQHVKRTTINTDFKDYCDTDFYDWHFYSNGELFGLARELSRFIISDGQNAQDPFNLFKRFDSNPDCSVFLLHSKSINFIYDICAIFLLVPADLFLNEYLSFSKKNGESQYLMEQWLKYLAGITNIPYYVLISNYILLKMFFCSLYQFENKQKDEQFMLKYACLYK